jgi:predicted ATPase/DNA-binding XRE family transcriptional regulator
MDGDASFGGWLRQRRKQLDLTQARLAAQVGCAAETLRKIESGRLRPSREIASRLAECLDVPAAERDAFVQAARGSATPTLPRAAEPVRTRLPAPLTSLIGREDELAELRTLLANPACRLITIVGPGGIGKTRLVLAIAAEQAALFPDGAALVSLAAVSTPALVAPAILAALDVPLQGQRDPREQLIEMLRDKGLLLVLDNFEQLLCAEGDSGDVTIALLRDVLHAAPSVQLLVTSRERLRMQGEWLFDLGGLCYPLDEAGVGLTETAAMQLFVERARQVRPHPALTNDELRAAGRICRLVEGMPLAIELAAAALRVQSCIAIADSLQESLATLSADLRAVPERHHSIRATFEHSWRLLSERERHVFARLPVFRGGFDLEAATHVAQADALLLAALVDKSLLRWDGMGRYDMHELMRQYAGEKLCEMEEVGQAQDRHLEFFLALAEDAAPNLRGRHERMWLDRLGAEHLNFRAALTWSATTQDDEQIGLCLVAALRWYWLRCGYWREGWSWYEHLLAKDARGATQTRAWALVGAGWLATFLDFSNAARVLLAESQEIWYQLGDTQGLAYTLLAQGELTHDLESAKAGRPLLEQSASLFRESGDIWGLAMALMELGNVAWSQGSRNDARDLYQQGLALFQQLEDKSGMAYALFELGKVANSYRQAAPLVERSQALYREMGDKNGIARAFLAMGSLARECGNYADAAVLYKQSQEVYREIGARFGDALVFVSLGNLARDMGEIHQAVRYYRQSLVVSQELGLRQFLAWGVEGLGHMAITSGQLEQAVRLFGAAGGLLGDEIVQRGRHDDAVYARDVALAHDCLDEATFAAAWAAGQAMTLEEAVAEALALETDETGEQGLSGSAIMPSS